MRRIPGPSRPPASLRRHASAGLVAALLSLFLSQPFHAPAPIDAEGAPALAAAPAGSPGAASGAPAHNADRCAQCRAFAKTRLGVRPAGACAFAADQPLFPLHWPRPAPPGAAAELRLTRPRAPPTA
jgi:hypothetical protein